MMKTKKVIAGALAAATLLSSSALLTGCGKKGSSDGPEYVYVPTYVTVNGDFSNGVNSLCFAGDKFYFLTYPGSGGAVYSGTGAESTAAAATGTDVSGTAQSPSLYSLDLQGKTQKLADLSLSKIPQGKEGSVNIADFDANDKGGFCTVEEMYTYHFDIPEGKTVTGDEKYNYQTMMVPVASVVLIWQVIFSYGGTMNQFLAIFGADKIDWLKSDYCLTVITILFLWKNLGYNMILFMAGLANIPKELLEVAAVEGATPSYSLFAIKLRYLSPTILFVTILSMPKSVKNVYTDAYCAFGKTSVTGDHGSSDASVIAVGGNYFLFHPLELVSGTYFSESDVMHDRVVLDETLAWKLFGGSNLAGMHSKWLSISRPPRIMKPLVAS